MRKSVIIFCLAAISAASAFAQAPKVTVKEFLHLSSSDTTSYVVEGVVSRIRSSSSGSFYLKDSTGTMLVYGIQDPEHPTRSFKIMDIKKGDTLAVQGRFTVYAGITKEMKDGRLLKKADGPNHNLSFYEQLDEKPVFKGKEGEEALAAYTAWVQEHLKATGTQGTAKVRFVIGRKGRVQEVEVLSSVSPDADKEILRVMRRSPKWKSGRADGRKVRVPYVISLEVK